MKGDRIHSVRNMPPLHRDTYLNSFSDVSDGILAHIRHIGSIEDLLVVRGRSLNDLNWWFNDIVVGFVVALLGCLSFGGFSSWFSF